jgi:hypothetical protein
MMAMIAKEGETISAINIVAGSFNDPIDYFDFIRERSGSNYNNYVGSTKANLDGYGFCYYEDSSYLIPCAQTHLETNYWEPTNQAWYLHGEGGEYYYHGNTLLLNNIYNLPLNIAESIISNNINYSSEPGYTNLQDDDQTNAVIVLGHARNGTGGTGNHPFRFEYDNRTYTFMQNGGLDNDFIVALETYLTALENGNWFANHTPNWVPFQTGSLVDTELLFHFIMSFIIDANDVNIGIQRALIQTDIEGVNILDKILYPDQVKDEETEERYYINVINFILSDGEDLYVFRNSPSNDVSHELSYRDNDDFYAIKTVSPSEGIIINQHRLMKFSRDEEPLVLFNLYQEIKNLKVDGYNWVSFPRLERDETTNEAEDIVPYLNNIYPFDDITYIDFIDISESVLVWDGDDWCPGNYLVKSTQAFKLDTDTVSEDDGHILPMTGTRLIPDYVIEENFGANTDYWLGYWLPETQNIVDAFGDLWQYVETVSAENWYYDKCSNNRGMGEAVPKSWITEGKNLEYGKGYVITFNDNFSDFSWTSPTSSRSVTIGYDPVETTYFSYHELPSYEVIDVLCIPDNVIEIGVYQGDVCVGAVAVQDSCEQILVYSQPAGRDEIPLRFEIITGRSSASPVLNYQVYNSITGRFETGRIMAGRQRSSIVMFGDIGKPGMELPNINKVIMHGNYPNPFNPSNTGRNVATTISFDITTESTESTELIIFNLKGQKVKQLVSGNLSSGEHLFTWDGSDDAGRPVSSGLYLYKLKVGDQEFIRKMLMLK